MGLKTRIGINCSQVLIEARWRFSVVLVFVVLVVEVCFVSWGAFKACYPLDLECLLGCSQGGNFGRWWTFRNLGPTGSSTGFQHLLHSLLWFCSTILFPAKVYCFSTRMAITAATSKAMSQNVHFPPIGPSQQFCYFDKRLTQGHYQRSSVYRILAQSRITAHCFNRFLCYEARPFRHLRTKMFEFTPCSCP